MLVKKIYDAEDLKEEFKAMNRDYYSLEGYQAIIDMFEETEEPTELDVIAIACEFAEETPEEVSENYGYTFDGGKTWSECIESGIDYDELMDALMDHLNYHTYAIDLGNGNILYQEF